MSLPQRPPLIKTRLCQYHLLQRCRYGSSCSFAHSLHELRVAPASVRKTKLCPLFETGLCYDSYCNYAHGVDELRDFPRRPSDFLPTDDLSNARLLLDMLNQVLTDDLNAQILDQVSA